MAGPELFAGGFPRFKGGLPFPPDFRVGHDAALQGCEGAGNQTAPDCFGVSHKLSELASEQRQSSQELWSCKSTNSIFDYVVPLLFEPLNACQGRIRKHVTFAEELDVLTHGLRVAKQYGPCSILVMLGIAGASSEISTGLKSRMESIRTLSVGHLDFHTFRPPAFARRCS